MDSPFTRSVQDSPFLRAYEGKYAHSSSFSLGPGMHETGEHAAAPDAPQSTADLTAFVQNLLQQMQSRFQSMSDAILVRIDDMASRIEELERAVDDVLREITVGDDDHVERPSPSSSPIRRTLTAPVSPDVRKYSIGPPGVFPPVSPLIGRFSSMSAAGTASLNSPEGRKQSTSSAGNVPSSPDHRRHSSAGQFIPSSPDRRRQPTSAPFAPASPDVRKAAVPIVPSSPGARRTSELQSAGTHLR